MTECVGCGFCCLKAKCDAAMRIHPSATRCPELAWNGKRYVCHLATLPGQLGFDYREELHIGAGCCCAMNTWRLDVKNRNEVQNTIQNPVPQELQLFARSLVEQMITGDVIFLTLSSFQQKLVETCGYTEDNAKEYCSSLYRLMKENRSSFDEGFMG